MPPLACVASKRLPRLPGEPQAGGELLLYALQLVNRLGSKRSRAELLMQSPVLQAREQQRVERLAAVEGECFCVWSILSWTPTGWGRARTGREPLALLIRAHFWEEGKHNWRRGLRGWGASAGGLSLTGAAYVGAREGWAVNQSLGKADGVV